MTGNDRAPALDPLEARVEQIEARQRDYGMHDPDCPDRQRERRQAESDMFWLPVPCTCWLSR